MNESSKINELKEASPLEALCRYVVLAALGGFVLSLYPLSRGNYLLFHSLIELSSIAVSVTLFSIGWNARQITRNDGFTLLAISFLVVAGLDLLHTLSYKGMGVFPSAGVDPPTQLWIAARSVQAISYLFASILFGKVGYIKHWSTLVFYSACGGLLALSVWPWQIFPSCLNEVTGLTTFKVSAEYLICLTFFASGLIFWKRQRQFEQKLLGLFLLSIGATIFSELAFTLYQDVYGINNVLGHFLKLLSVIFVYRAFVFGSLRDPYQTLFHELNESHIALDHELAIRRNTEEQLRNANHDLEAFVRTASHDLRSPLTVITSGAELLQSELADQINKEQENLITSIHKQGHRMSRLLNDLLCLARVGSIDQPPERLDPGLIAARVIEDLSQEILTQRCKVQVEEMPEIRAHPSLIYQLLLNLIANAVRYGNNPEKPVQVCAEINGNTCRLLVRDHGPGVPDEERERIFDVFYRAEKNQPQGTGVGLATVRKIARHYSGAAWVEETPGGGATFWVEFEMPVIEDDK